MKRIITSALIFASLSACSNANQSTITNDEYDRLYMANKFVNICDADNNDIINESDLGLINNEGDKNRCKAFLKSIDGEISRSEYVSTYELPKIETTADLIRNIEYKKAGDLRLMLDLYMPNDIETKNDTPIVLYIHGGGWTSGDKYIATVANHINIINELTSKGVAVAALNYRLANNTDTYIKDCLCDVKDALAFLNKESKTYGLDTSRSVVWGGSAGGHLAQMASFSDPSDFAGDEELLPYRVKPIGLVSWYGAGSLDIEDRLESGESTKDPDSFFRRICASDNIETIRKGAKDMSPISHIDPQAPPALIMAGDMDTAVSVEKAYELDHYLSENGVDHELIIVKNAGHNWRGTNIEPSLENIWSTTAEHILRFVSK